MKAFTSANLMIVALAWTTSVSPARAQDATAAPAPAAAKAVEVTPFVSIDSRGSSPIGVATSLPLRSAFSIETEVGYRRAEGSLNVLSLSANLLYALPRAGRTTPYVAAGAGLAEYGAPVVSREGFPIGTQPRLALEVNAGGGLKVPVDDTWGMRTDARCFKSFGRDGGEHFRVAQGISFDVAKR